MHLSIYVFILFIIINKKHINKRATCAICLKYLEENYSSAEKSLEKLSIYSSLSSS